MIQQYEQQQDPNLTINLLYTLRWISQAWRIDLQDNTIYRCFRKAKIQPQAEPILLPQEHLPDLSSLYNEVQIIGNVRDAMNIENFLNPEDENIPLGQEVMTGDERLSQLIAEHIGQQEEEQQEEELEDDIVASEVIPTPKEALEAVEALIRYQERQAGVEFDDIRHLITLQRRILAGITASKQQRTLESWLI
jgi:hypothetical protein